jgi:secondary thiamine-phosphate synthase enzyme
VSPPAVTITGRTSRREEMVDITGRVADALGRLGVEDGLVHVWVPHTTAGVTVNEGADPAVRRDLLLALAAIVPEDLAWEHEEGNSPAHVKTTLVGSSALVPVAGGRPALGRWQAVYLCEFDGPRSRTVRLAAGGGPSASK